MADFEREDRSAARRARAAAGRKPAAKSLSARLRDEARSPPSGSTPVSQENTGPTRPRAAQRPIGVSRDDRVAPSREPIGEARPPEVLGGLVRQALNSCTGCGICNAVCPTYLATLDEREGPRGRIAMMLGALDGAGSLAGDAVGETIHPHIDRCLTCGACEAVCPEDVAFGSGIAAMRALLDQKAPASGAGRLRRQLARQLANPETQQRSLRLARAVRPLHSLLARSGLPGFDDVVGDGPKPAKQRAEFAGPGEALTRGERRGRVLMLPTCTARVFRPAAADAAIRLLARQGFDVIVPPGVKCCGALADQLGVSADASNQRQVTVDAVGRAVEKLAEEDEGARPDAIVTLGPVCQAALSKSFAADSAFHPFGGGRRSERDDHEAFVQDLIASAVDVSVFLAQTDFGAPQRWSALRIGRFGHCRRQETPSRASDLSAADAVRLLTDAGYTVVDASEPGTCCGGVGLYPWLAPALSAKLRQRKLAEIPSQDVDLLAVEDVGCAAALREQSATPAVHMIELLDWAYGGPIPDGLEKFAPFMTDVPRPDVPQLDVQQLDMPRVDIPRRDGPRPDGPAEARNEFDGVAPVDLSGR
ncbi:MAG: heterodisulfide reductase-related iron-sulfur binding cluster [Pseudomonadota bacterium]